MPTPPDPQTLFRPNPPLVIGLLGGVAAGKSTIARILADRGLRVVDADVEARRVVAQPEILTAIRSRFGDDIVASDGGLDRAALAALVFADPAARRDLEGLTHPAIRAQIETQIETGRRAGQSVALDVPLLLEHGLIERCDLCLFVDSSTAARQARAAARGWGPEEIGRREASQASLTVKKKRCAYTIQNDGSLEDTERQVVEILTSLGNDS